MKKQLFTAALALFVCAAAHAAPCNTTTDKSNPTPLMFSARTGDTQNVRCLLEEGADANATNSVGGTALMSAALFGHTDIARLLIEKARRSIRLSPQARQPATPR